MIVSAKLEGLYVSHSFPGLAQTMCAEMHPRGDGV
jgi:hypothetical protein